MSIEWTTQERVALGTVFMDGNHSEVDPLAIVEQVVVDRLRQAQATAWEQGRAADAAATNPYA
jgi:hypothetical protein